MMLLTGCLDGRLAGLQCVSGVVILVLICVGQGLVRGCRCITDIALHSTVAPRSSSSSHVTAECYPVSDVYCSPRSVHNNSF